MHRHVYYYTLLARGYEHAAAVLAADPAAWLPSPVTELEDGWQVELCADGALPAGLARHLARVDVGSPRGGDAISVPLRWRSAVSDRMLPVLEAELELSPLSGGGAHLSLLGSYRPPLSVMGGAGDLLVGHRVAEACVRRFVLDVADRLSGVTLTV
jgi:hypothetical protein